MLKVKKKNKILAVERLLNTYILWALHDSSCNTKKKNELVLQTKLTCNKRTLPILFDKDNGLNNQHTVTIKLIFTDQTMYMFSQSNRFH